MLMLHVRISRRACKSAGFSVAYSGVFRRGCYANVGTGCRVRLSLPTLRHRVRLHVSVIVLAGPDEAAVGLHGLGHHVVDQTVLVPDSLGLELSLVLPGTTAAAGTCRYSLPPSNLGAC